MNCFDCPYGYDGNPKEEYICCDKVGGKTTWFGCCTDAFDPEETQVKKSNKKRKTKKERDNKHKNRLKWLSEHNLGYPCPAMGIYLSGFYHPDDEEPIYHKRLYRTTISSYLTRQSNKTIRRYKNEIFKGWQCHKLYDFWWELT